MKKRADGRYRVKFTGDDGKTHYVYGKTVAEVKAAELEARKRISAGLVDKATVTLDEYAALFMEQREGKVRESTARITRQHYETLSRHIGKMKLAKITRPVVLKLQKDLLQDPILRCGKPTGKTLTEKGVNDRIGLLFSILKAAVADRLIPYNPVDGVGFLQKTNVPARETIHRALTEEEIAIFFDAAKNCWYFNLFRFLILTGCRTCEATALRLSDIDYRAGVVHITKTVETVDNKDAGPGEAKYSYIIYEKPKTSRSKRDIPITGELREVLEDQKRIMREFFGGASIIRLDGYLFLNQKGNFVTASDGNQAIRNVLHYLPEDKKIEKFTDHALRATFATHALRAGMNINVLKEILGHTSFSMTLDLYGHVLEDQKAGEMEKLRLFG